jgi:hypothetical protein
MSSTNICAADLTDHKGDKLISLFESGNYAKPIKLMSANEAAHLTLSLLHSLSKDDIDWVIQSAARDRGISNTMLLAINTVKVNEQKSKS